MTASQLICDILKRDGRKAYRDGLSEAKRYEPIYLTLKQVSYLTSLLRGRTVVGNASVQIRDGHWLYVVQIQAN